MDGDAGIQIADNMFVFSVLFSLLLVLPRLCRSLALASIQSLRSDTNNHLGAWKFGLILKYQLG